MKNWIIPVVMLASGLLATEALAVPSNNPPPVGNVILDLNGTPVPHSYTTYSINFLAVSSITNLTFAFRDDSAFLNLDDVKMKVAGGSGNLIDNGNFTNGTLGSGAPDDWTHLNPSGATSSGVLAGMCGSGMGSGAGGRCYHDGAIQAYDMITQAVSTVAGVTYNVKFDLVETGTSTTFSRLSTNGNTTGAGGNGVDLIVYAGAIPMPAPTAAPEPASLSLLGASLLGLGLMRRRKAG